eukprot:29257-Pleurochrysis_carterae.AAC.2
MSGSQGDLGVRRQVGVAIRRDDPRVQAEARQEDGHVQALTPLRAPYATPSLPPCDARAEAALSGSERL